MSHTEDFEFGFVKARSKETWTGTGMVLVSQLEHDGVIETSIVGVRNESEGSNLIVCEGDHRRRLNIANVRWEEVENLGNGHE